MPRRGFWALCAAAWLLGVAFTILAAVAVHSAEPAIPLDPYGHVMLIQGSPGATAKVEVYLDLACSDCALAWPVMSHVAEVYGNDAEFLYRLFPLPYHRNAFTAAKAAKTIRLISDGDDASVASFFTAVFDEQDHISNDATENMTQRQIGAIFASWATSTTGISVDDFNIGMADSEVEMQTRSQFKYGCIHGVRGTPMVYIGGVLVDGLDGDSTFQDWQDVLEPLLSSSSTTTTMTTITKGSWLWQ